MARNYRYIQEYEKEKLNSFDEARQLINDYIYIYNHQRLQSRTKLIPLKKRNQFVV